MAGFLASILIPCYNEAANLPACLASLFTPELAEECQWLIIDGRSTDQTPAVARDLSGRIPNLTLIDNPLRLQAHGLNQGLAAAQGRYIIRADAHSLYPPDYIKNLIALLKETGAWNAGGRMKPVGQSPFRRAAARAMSHPLGVGDARFHLGGFKGPVDTVYLGAFPAWVFERVGLFDPAAHPNEDAELNLRIRLAGGTIFLDGEIEVAYHPRPTPARLAAQYFSYGRGRAYTTFKHHRFTSPRQLAPPVLLIVLAASLIAAWFWPWAWLIPGLYLALLAAAAAPAAARGPDGLKGGAWLGLSFLIMHLSWAAGFLSRGISVISRRLFLKR